jgi:hypothetical protein
MIFNKKILQLVITASLMICALANAQTFAQNQHSTTLFDVSEFTSFDLADQESSDSLASGDIKNAAARVLYTHPLGFTFSSARGWKVEQTAEQKVFLLPYDKDENEAIILSSEYVPNVAQAYSTQFVSLMDAEIRKNLPNLARVGTPESLQTNIGTGILLVYQGTSSSGIRAEARFYGVINNGNTYCIVALGPSQAVAAHDGELRRVFASFTLDKSAAAADQNAGATAAEGGDSPLAQQWLQHLRGKKVTYLSSYSSGSGGGYSSEWHLYLAANGTFSYSSQSSVSVYVPGATGGSNGQNSSSGRWRIYTTGNQAILELQYTDGRVQRRSLSYTNNKTFFDRTRVFVTEP